MKIQLLFVGKTVKSYFSDAISEYVSRLKHYTSFEIEVISDLKNTKNLSESQQKEREGELILKTFDVSDFVVLLDDKGSEFTSLAFSSWLEKRQQYFAKRLVFVIGGAYGFSDAVYQRANEKISLSKLTFSHQLVRLVFVEQLYRAFTILKGEPYHHE